jgi:hypothetical protein
MRQETKTNEQEAIKMPTRKHVMPRSAVLSYQTPYSPLSLV